MRFDLHIHSKYSFDSLLQPKAIIRTAKKQGLDGIAVVDHGTVRGGLETKKQNQDPEFTVIVGCEVNSTIGDIIGLFIEEEITSTDPIEAIEQIKSQGGIVVLPHPYRGHERLEDDVLTCVDAIEAFNSRTPVHLNEKARELAEKYKKPVVAGSDAHFSAEIGRSRTITPPGDIKRNILTGKTRIEGDVSPGYLVMMSQMIRAAKKKDIIAAARYSAKTLLELR